VAVFSFQEPPLPSQFILPRQVKINVAGRPYAGAKAYFYRTDTEVLQTVYQDAGLTTAHDQPVVATDDGYWPVIWLNSAASADYRVVIYSATNVLLDDLQSVPRVLFTSSEIATTLESLKQTQAEITAGVTPVNYAHEPYVRARYASWSDWQIAADAANAVGIVNQPYTLTANITLPLRSDFRGNVISGAFQLLFQNKSFGWIENLHFNDIGASVRLSGCQQCRFDNFKVRKVLVDGFNASIGYFWNMHRNWMVEECEADITLFAINANTWQDSVIRYFHTEGDTSVSAFSEFNANLFLRVDFSDYGDLTLPVSGFVQNDSRRRKNLVQSAYYENGSDIVANCHIIGVNGDTDAPPRVDRNCHIFGNTGVNMKSIKDFLSVQTVNQAVGGDWSIRDADNKPPCFTHSGGASVQVVADTTEPNGIGSRWQATFEQAFDQFNITIRGNGQSFVGGYIYYKSTADFEQMSVGDGTTTASLPVTPILLGDDWKLLRFSGPSHPVNGATVVLFGYAATGGAAKTISLGGVSAGTEQAVIPPQRPLRIHRYASATVDPASLNDGEGSSISTITVTGASLGDFVKVSHSTNLGGVLLQAWVSATNTVSYRFQNETGGTVDIASGTLRVEVESSFA
jgi:hypothetical protein